MGIFFENREFQHACGPQDVCGAHRGGNHVAASDGTPMANAMLTMLNRLGHDLDAFGDSSGELSL